MKTREVTLIRVPVDDGIPIEVCKCLGEEDELWLTKLFNGILRSKKMPNEWRRSTLVALYKDKGDIQDCANDRRIKLMTHMMKLWEKVIKHTIICIYISNLSTKGLMER